MRRAFLVCQFEMREIGDVGDVFFRNHDVCVLVIRQLEGSTCGATTNEMLRTFCPAT